MEFMPNQLWVSVPDLAWYADNMGVIWLRFDDACQLLLTFSLCLGSKGQTGRRTLWQLRNISTITCCLEQELGRAAFEDDES